MLRVLYHVICSQWNPLASPGIDHVYEHSKGTDSLFSHICMTAMHEAKWLASTKKARLSLSQPSLPNESTAAL